MSMQKNKTKHKSHLLQIVVFFIIADHNLHKTQQQRGGGAYRQLLILFWAEDCGRFGTF